MISREQLRKLKKALSVELQLTSPSVHENAVPKFFKHTLTEMLSLLHLSSLALLIRFEAVQIWYQAAVILSAPRPVDSSNPSEIETKNHVKKKLK